ncbi:MAG: hypothetical protein ACLTMP_09425 [Eggerthella lenta]
MIVVTTRWASPATWPTASVIFHGRRLHREQGLPEGFRPPKSDRTKDFTGHIS